MAGKRTIRNGTNGRSHEDPIVALEREGAFARASRAAIRKQRAMGIPITFKRGRQVIKRYPDGREEVLEILARSGFRLAGDVRRIDEK